ncbi:hypothetical protein LLG10_04110 [bacterium]|nr:hypothetical protein [bacterium]
MKRQLAFFLSVVMFFALTGSQNFFLPTAKAADLPVFQQILADNNEGQALDIEGISVVADTDVVIFKFTFYQKWNHQTSNYNLFIMLDSDNNSKTGTDGSEEMRHGFDNLVFLGFQKGKFMAVLNRFDAKMNLAFLEEIPFYYLPVHENYAYIAVPLKYAGSARFWVGCNNHTTKEYDCYPEENSKEEAIKLSIQNKSYDPYLKTIKLQINSKMAKVDNQTLFLDAAPYIKNGKTFVAFRFIGENIGSSVGYKPGNNKDGVEWVSYLLNLKSIFLFIGKKTGYVNGKSITVDPPPEIIKNRTMVPLRFVSENLNCLVKWEEKTQSITIIALKYAEKKQGSVETVENFLHAQVSEDIESQLNYVDLGRFGPEGDANARTLLTELNKKVDISNLNFIKHANADFEKEELAIVRYSTTYHLSNSSGKTNIHNASFAYLQKRNGIWKIVLFAPDEFLGIQFMLEDTQNTLTHPADQFNADTDLSKIRSVNQRLNEGIHQIRIDKFKSSLDTTFSLVGFIPGAGDTISNAYTAVDMAMQIPNIASDIRLGNYNCAYFGFVQIGWGAVQILAEYIPGADHGTDALAILLDNSVLNARYQWAFLMIKNAMINTRISGKKYLYPLFKSGITTPKDVRYVEINDWPLTSMTPPETLYIMSDKAYLNNLSLNFAMIGCVKIELKGSKELESACALLKAKFDPNNDLALFPVIFRNIVEEALYEGANVLGKMNAGQRIEFAVSCERGIQFLKLKTTDGSYTEPLIIENYIYNVINNISAYDKNNKLMSSLNTKVNEKIEGIKLIGIIPSGIKSELNLKNDVELSRVKCLQYMVEDARIAEVTNNGTSLSVRGKQNGRTILKLIYFGSPGIYHRNAVLDLSVMVPISVGDSFELDPKEVTLKINEVFSWKVTVTNPPASYYTKWNFGDDTGWFDSGKSSIKFSNTISMNHGYKKPGTYEIQVNLIDAGTGKTITYTRGKAIIPDSGSAYPKHISFGIYLYNEYTLDVGETIRDEIRYNLKSDDEYLPGKVTWSGNTFTYNMNKNEDNTSIKVTLVGTLSKDFKTIQLKMNILGTDLSSNTQTPIEESMSFEFRNLPINTYYYDDKTFEMRVKGEQLKNYMISFQHDYQYEDLSTETGKYFIGHGKYSKTIWNENSAISCYGYHQ